MLPELRQLRPTDQSRTRKRHCTRSIAVIQDAWSGHSKDLASTPRYRFHFVRRHSTVTQCIDVFATQSIVALRRCRSGRHGGRDSTGDTGWPGNPPCAESLSRPDRDKAAAVKRIDQAMAGDAIQRRDVPHDAGGMKSLFVSPMEISTALHCAAQRLNYSPLRGRESTEFEPPR